MKVKHNAGSGFTAFPEGTYDMRITSTEETVSKAGKPQLKVSLEVLDGDPERIGQTATIWYSLSPQAAWKLNMLAEATGVDSTETGERTKDDKPVLEFDTDDLDGLYVRYTCTQEVYDKKIVNRWEEERPSPMDPDYDEDGDDSDDDGGDAVADVAPQPVAPVAVSGGIGRRRRPGA